MSHRFTGTAYGLSADSADWRDLALCRDGDPELHFPLGGDRGEPRVGPQLLQEWEAKKVCARCPVADDCATWAIETGQSYGIWGGLNESERRKSSPGRLRMRNTGRMPTTHCPANHPYDEDNTFHDSRGHRCCRACARIRMSAAYKSKAVAR